MNLRSVVFIFPIVFFRAISIIAQSPAPLSLDKNIIAEKIENSCNNFAGTINGFGEIKGKSITISLDQIILCFGDSLEIKHKNDFNLSDDPNPFTSPGIGYALYNCKPIDEYEGPGITQISRDPCLNKLPKYGSVPLTDSFWIVTDKINGDITLFNQGQIQNGFNLGKPIQIWLAPITLDDFNNQKIEAGSSCTQVNTSAAFPVIYLNDISVIPLPSSCQNAIVINGGLPEFDSTLNYIINIYLKDDPSVKGQLENFGGNGDTIFFEVPRPGEYWIEISDQTGCERIFNFEVFNCAALFIDLPQKNVAENSSFCVPIQVRNFTDILSLQFALQWDSLILQYDRINISDPSILPGLNSSGFNIFENSVNFSWDVGTMPEISIPDSSPIFEICFTAIGNLENCTPIEIIEKFDFPLEVVDVSTKSIGLIAPPGEICISNSPLIIQNTIYPVECRGENSGKFMFRIFGGFPPYSFEFENNFYGNIQEGEEIVFSSLQTGNYTLEVEDNVGNQRNISFLIEDGVELEINSEVFSPTCYGGNDGKITTTLLINGKNELPSSGLYSYSWSTGKSDWEQVGLKSGAYQLTVTHQNGCTQ
ncbi:MAG: hypothetical protein RJA52_36, partial [Bacteroidota bacterium]